MDKELLQRARGLLTQSSMSVLEVAMACRLLSASHFSKCYRDFFKRTPREVTLFLRPHTRRQIKRTDLPPAGRDQHLEQQQGCCRRLARMAHRLAIADQRKATEGIDSQPFCRVDRGITGRHGGARPGIGPANNAAILTDVASADICVAGSGSN